MTKEKEVAAGAIQAEQPVVLKRISDILGDQSYQGNVFKIPEVLNQDLILTGYITRTSETGEYMVLRCKHEIAGEEFGVNCGSKVVMKQVKQLEEAGAFPILAMFKKQKKYYVLV